MKKIPKNLRIGRRVQNRRRVMDLTQEDLADRVGVSRVYMGYIEQGRNVPSFRLLGKMARVLRVRMSDLLD